MPIGKRTNSDDGDAIVGERRARLARLLPLWPEDLADDSTAGRLKLVSRLQSVLRAERRRGLAGHWTYDPARHRDLLAACRRELAPLPRQTRALDGGSRVRSELVGSASG
jgi:hypothetical protein